MTHRTDHRPCRPGRVAGAVPLGNRLRCGLLLAALVVLASCGLKTPPRPLSEVLKPTAGLEARHRGSDLLVSWQPPEGDVVKQFGPPRGYVLRVQHLPLLCLDCAPPSPERIDLPTGAPELVVQGGRLYYALEFPPDAGRLRIQVETRFSAGATPPGRPVLVERAGAIPTPSLEWRWVGATAEDGGASPAGGGVRRAVQFFWAPQRERIVQVIAPDGKPQERVVDYRANLYRRIPPEPWPLAPLNPEPLEATQWIVPPLQVDYPPHTPGEAYALRYVDRFGNEGPSSAEVLIPLPERRP